MKMPLDWAGLWKAETGMILNRRHVALFEKLPIESDSQVRWILSKYHGVAPHPNVRDFIEWVDVDELPEPLVAEGLMSGNQELLDVADRLQTLQAAWYPTEDTKRQITELENVLRRAQ